MLMEWLESDKEFVRNLHEKIIDVNVHKILVRGINNEDKILAVFAAVSKLYKDKPTLEVTLSTSSLQHETELLKDVQSKYAIRGKVNSVTGAKLNKFLGVKFNAENYYRNPNLYSFSDIKIYHPVEGVLFKESDFTKFYELLNSDKSKTSIIVTTNDYNGRADRLRDWADTEVVLNSKEKYPEQYLNILKNLNIEKLSYE